jgi:hypothetical protein
MGKKAQKKDARRAAKVAARERQEVIHAVLDGQMSRSGATPA